MVEETVDRGDIKQLIVESLHLEKPTADAINDDTTLFGADLGLDSVDALELIVAIERKYGIEVQGHEIDKTVFTSVTTLTEFVTQRLVERVTRIEADGT